MKKTILSGTWPLLRPISRSFPKHVGTAVALLVLVSALNQSAHAQAVGGTGGIGGAGLGGGVAIIQGGVGTLAFNGANSYTGGTTVNAGTLALAGAAARPPCLGA